MKRIIYFLQFGLNKKNCYVMILIYCKDETKICKWLEWGQREIHFLLIDWLIDLVLYYKFYKFSTNCLQNCNIKTYLAFFLETISDWLSSTDFSSTPFAPCQGYNNVQDCLIRIWRTHVQNCLIWISRIYFFIMHLPIICPVLPKISLNK